MKLISLSCTQKSQKQKNNAISTAKKIRNPQESTCKSLFLCSSSRRLLLYFANISLINPNCNLVGRQIEPCDAHISEKCSHRKTLLGKKNKKKRPRNKTYPDPDPNPHFNANSKSDWLPTVTLSPLNIY